MADVETPEVEEVIEEPQVEPEVAEEPEPLEEPELEAEPEEPVAEEKPPSRRESLRIQALVEKLKEKDSPRDVPKSVSDFDYKTELDADPEVIAKLEAERDRLGRSQYEAGLQRAESIQFSTRLEIDAPKIEAKFPVMDPQGDKFDPVVANAINQWYLATTGYNPETGQVKTASVRYADFVEGIMELADALAGEKTQQSSKAIARQAAQTGIRPGGTTAKGLDLNKAPQAMTDEELEARIATALGK